MLAEGTPVCAPYGRALARDTPAARAIRERTGSPTAIAVLVSRSRYQYGTRPPTVCNRSSYIRAARRIPDPANEGISWSSRLSLLGRRAQIPPHEMVAAPVGLFLSGDRALNVPQQSSTALYLQFLNLRYTCLTGILSTAAGILSVPFKDRRRISSQRRAQGGSGCWQLWKGAVVGVSSASRRGAWPFCPYLAHSFATLDQQKNGLTRRDKASSAVKSSCFIYLSRSAAIPEPRQHGNERSGGPSLCWTPEDTKIPESSEGQRH